MRERIEIPEIKLKEKTLQEEKIEIFQKYFPNAIRRDSESGHFIINTKALQEELDPRSMKIDENQYGLHWVGKKLAKGEAYSINRSLIKPLEKESKNFDETQNILIKGDNLAALRLLRQSYTGKVKMIYIDPPYNTKSDAFVYHDNFSVKEEELLERMELEKEEKDYIENIYSAQTHSGWLSFMYPRLVLARELLKEDGVIFVSIDDNEQAQLKLMMDEIFGQDNFVGDFIRKTKSTTNDSKSGVNYQHEFLLCYAKNKEKISLLGGEKDLNGYTNPDNDPKGEWKSSDPSAKSGTQENNYFPIVNPYTGKEDYPPSGMYWRFSKNTVKTHIEEGTICFKKEHKENERGFIYKRYLNNLKTTKKTFNSLVFTDNAYMNQSFTKDLKELGLEEYFTYPKGSNFLKEIIRHSTSPDSSDIILDFFAGSGTTGQAVMEMNQEGGGGGGFNLFLSKFLKKPLPKVKPIKQDIKPFLTLPKHALKKQGLN